MARKKGVLAAEDGRVCVACICHYVSAMRNIVRAAVVLFVMHRLFQVVDDRADMSKRVPMIPLGCRDCGS